MAPRYAPIGHFGIGLLSCFMLARSLTLRTAATAGEGLSLRLADPNSLFRVIEFSATEPGTTVEIELLADLDVNLEALVRHYAPAARRADPHQRRRKAGDLPAPARHAKRLEVARRRGVPQGRT